MNDVTHQPTNRQNSINQAIIQSNKSRSGTVGLGPINESEVNKPTPPARNHVVQQRKTGFGNEQVMTQFAVIGYAPITGHREEMHSSQVPHQNQA
jgi:hypothetical protein